MMNRVSGRILSDRSSTVRPSPPGSWTSHRTTSGSNDSTSASADGHVGGRRDLESLPLEEFVEGPGDHLLVVDDQDRGRAWPAAPPDGRPRRASPLPSTSSRIDSSPTSRGRREPGRRGTRRRRRGAIAAGLERQPDDERGALPQLRAIVELPRDVLEDLPADEQPQPGAMRLGGEERLEQPAAVGQRDPAAVVLDAQDQPVALDAAPRRGSCPWSSVASIALSTRLSTTWVR